MPTQISIPVPARARARAPAPSLTSKLTPNPTPARRVPLSVVCLVLANFAPARSPAAPASAPRPAPARGPLRVHPKNPRYFTDGTGRAVYLTGSHTWNQLVDMGESDPPARFDFDAYVRWLAAYPHDFIRLWTWELVEWDTRANRDPAARVHHAAPQPWLRAGPGNALDGKPRFDLARFDPAYFGRLRKRVRAAGDRGIYVSVMLFEGWGLQRVSGSWKSHPFHPSNNINGVDGDANGDGVGVEVHELVDPKVTALQEAYVRKVIDTVGDLDNVLYEISNENHPASTAWQTHMIRFVKAVEARRPKQHPVGMTFQYRGGSNRALFESPADWISPNPEGGYRDDPPVADGSKVVITDTDHLWGIGGNPEWVWKSFFRGLNPIFMDPYRGAVLTKGFDEKRAEAIRHAMAETLRLARRVDLAGLVPAVELASSRYCLARVEGKEPELLVYAPRGREVTVDLSAVEGKLRVEWLDTRAGTTRSGAATSGGERREFKSPFAGPSVLHLTALREPEEIGWRASGRGGAVAAGGAEAVEAGIRLLRAGGNAADAAAATLFALAVTDYGWFAMGGEVPLLWYDARTGRVRVLCGLGRAPLDPAAIEWFYEHGIPSRGSMKAAPVPGAVHLSITLLELGGTRSLEEVLAPTLEILDRAEKEWHPRLARTLRRLVERERETAGTRREKLAAARERFYRGDIAGELESWYRETGAFLRRPDLAAHRTLVEEPVTVEYRGYRVHKCGPWTQGPVLAQALRLLEGFDLRAMGLGSAREIHIVAEALGLAFADRDTYYGDPLFADVPLRELLSDSYTEARRALIDPRRASLEQRPGDPRRGRALLEKKSARASSASIPVQDTTTCLVADRWGSVIAATPSCNILTNRPGALGITQGNRVRSLNTTRGHPNRVEAGKRPRITLTPTLVTRGGKAVLAVSVAGGDLQDQTSLNMLLAAIDFGLPPAEAVRAVRFSTSHHENSFDPNPDRAATFGTPGGLVLDARISEPVQKELARRGHPVETTERPIGYPVMLRIDPATGLIEAAGDPRARRHAAAIDGP